MASFKISEHPYYLHLDFFAPQSGNSLGFSVARELGAIQKRYSRWQHPVVVSSAHPTLFCSGGNLSDYKKLKTKAAGLKVNREIQAGLERFAAWPVVKLALIEGDVLGGGMEWLGFFDYRWSTPSALFSFWQRRIGLSPGWGGGRTWARQIGEEPLRRLLCEARLLSAETALSHGLVDRLLSTWNIRDKVSEWARQMSTPVTRRMLQWNVKKEAREFSGLWLGPEHKSALKKWQA